MEARQDLRLCRATVAVALGKLTEPRRPQPTCKPPASCPPSICPTGPGRPSLHHRPGSWGRRPARSRRRPWPRPTPGPLAHRHHDGGDRPVPGAHRALGDAAAGEGAGGGQARAGRGRYLRGREGVKPWGLCGGGASDGVESRENASPGEGDLQD